MDEHRATRGSRARRRPSSWALFGSCIVLGAATFAACASEKHVVAPAPAPGAPAYWESNVPGADPGAVPERMPAPGRVPINPEGTTDKFLWDEGAKLETGPDSQAALQGSTGGVETSIADRIDGGAEGGLDAGPP